MLTVARVQVLSPGSPVINLPFSTRGSMGSSYHRHRCWLGTLGIAVRVTVVIGINPSYPRSGRSCSSGSA